MAAPQSVVETAPAKVNLYLEVTGRRPDGYHLLDSLVAFSDYGDEVEIAQAEGLSLVIDGPFAASLREEPLEQNLVMRAARALAEATGRAPGARIRLTKRLPVASGIGGGSADAAATLRGLARLWGMAPADPRLGDIARRLGQDVPACLVSRPCLFLGIGDQTLPIAALPELDAVLVNPGAALPTPGVFRARRGSFSEVRPPWLAPPVERPAFIEALAGRRNDLTAAAISLAPEIAVVLARLASLDGHRLARMSGSGATCFGLYDTAAAATRAAAALAAEQPGWWVIATTLLGTRPAHNPPAVAHSP